MLWTGQGLANLLPWLPAGARAALAVWLPVAFKVAIGLIVVGVVYRLFFSQPRDRGRHLRGSRLVTHRWAALRKRLALDQHRLRIGGVAFPRKLESLHLLITGATGAGKSQTLQGTLDTIRGAASLWSPGAHDEIIRDSYGKILTATEIGWVQQASREFDSAHQSAEESYMHAMRDKDQSPEEAMELTASFIAERIAAARAYAQVGNRRCALVALGQAIHPVMDASSPMHTTPNGLPKVWNPWWPFGHSPNDMYGNETIWDLTPAIPQQQNDALNNVSTKCSTSDL